MNKFFSSFLTIKGNKVDMSIIEMLKYGLLPGFGQLLMRIDKFGGSLDKPYLLFPLFLFPPFSFIPVLIAKFGFLKKENSKDILDIYIIIPIIFRFILMFIMAYIGNDNLLLQFGLTFGSVILANILHVTNNEQCKSIKGSFGKMTIKILADSMIEYSAGIAVLLGVSFIPIVGTLLNVFRIINLPVIGNISKTIDITLWSIGLVCGYMIMNMLDTNYYSTKDSCGGNIGTLRLLISIIAFAMSVFYQFRDQIINLVGNKILT
jgi:hypothetical protein